jgi:trigger factor
MQIDQLKEDGLKREFKVVYAAEEVDAKINERLVEVGQKIRMPGFRPGKAPLSLLKKLHGKAVLGEVLDQLVQEGSTEVTTQKALKPALRPNVEILSFEDGASLEFRIDIEILPEVEVPDFTKIKLERLVTVPAEDEIEQALVRLAGQHRRFRETKADHKAANGEVVVIDFEGKIDGKTFEGGTAEGHQLELGSGTFIPGFEEQLLGLKAGDEAVVTVEFPLDYHAADLAGKPVRFDVKIKSVRIPVEALVDDTLAQELGLADLKALRKTVQQQVSQEGEGMSRAILKRRLLDALAEKVDFEIPEGMVEIEYKQIWEQIKFDAINSGEAKAEDLKDMDEPADPKERAEFHNIAERRVRLGLLLSEVGTQNDVQVTSDEVSRRLLMEAQRYPGREKEIFDYYQNNENAMASLRAPIFEDKVCDLILDAAALTEKPASQAELEAAVLALEDLETPPAEKKPAKKSKRATKTKSARAGKSGASKSKATPKGKAKTAVKKSGKKAGK